MKYNNSNDWIDKNDSLSNSDQQKSLSLEYGKTIKLLRNGAVHVTRAQF